MKRYSVSGAKKLSRTFLVIFCVELLLHHRNFCLQCVHDHVHFSQNEILFIYLYVYSLFFILLSILDCIWLNRVYLMLTLLQATYHTYTKYILLSYCCIEQAGRLNEHLSACFHVETTFNAWYDKHLEILLNAIYHNTTLTTTTNVYLVLPFHSNVGMYPSSNSVFFVRSVIHSFIQHLFVCFFVRSFVLSFFLCNCKVSNDLT